VAARAGLSANKTSAGQASPHGVDDKRWRTFRV